MGRKRKQSISIITPIITIILMGIVFSTISSGTIYTWNTIGDILDDNESYFVFNFRFEFSFEPKYLDDYEFLYGDRLTSCWVEIQRKNPETLNVDIEEIIITSPSNKNYSFNSIRDYDNIFLITLQSDNVSSLVLNEPGIWWINIEFSDAGKTIKWKWLYNDPVSRSFDVDKEVELFRGSGINVYSNLEYQQLRAAKSLESSSELTIWSTRALFVASAAAVVTILFYLLKYKKEQDEKQIEKKAECKYKVSETLIEFYVLLLKMQIWLIKAKKNIYSFPEQKELSSIYENFIKKMALNTAYVSNFKEGREYLDENRSLFNRIVDFIQQTWPKFDKKVNKKDIDIAISEIDKILLEITDFLKKPISKKEK